MRNILITAVVGASAAALIGAIAVAQTTPEVTVQATRAVTTKLVGRTSSGIPIEEVSLSYRVSAADLDLASAAGAQQLEKRVNDAALAACKEIGRQYPTATPSDSECAKAAAKQAMDKAHELIHAASKAAVK